MFALLAATLLLVRPEPGPVTISAADREKAAGLVRALGSESFAERDQAQKDLWTMGRHALYALKAGAENDADPEVRRRAELLLPRAAALDFEARLAAFLADSEDKFHYAIPGWDKFRDLTSNEPAAREFYVDMLRSRDNRHLLDVIDRDRDDQVSPVVDGALVGGLAFVGLPKRGELAQRVVNRKQDLYLKMYPRSGRGEERYEPTPEDAATILFCDTVLGDNGAAVGVGVRVATPSILLVRTRVNAAVLSARTGPVLKKLLVNWLDTRTTAAGLYQGLTLTANLRLPEGIKYAAKLIEMDGAPTLYRATAAVTVAKLGDRADAKYLLPLMTETATVRNVINGNGEIQLRDVALAQAANLTGHGAETFGMRSQSAGDYAKYYYWNYSFPNEEARDKGFAKWAELEPKLVPMEAKK